MRIEWSITKQRGNIRPVLAYSFIVEKFEKELALPPILVESTIPEPLEPWQGYCYPNEFERSQIPEYKGCYRLELISHKGRTWKQELRLPWRADNDYPEVEESFQRLREAFEKELSCANQSAPMNECASMQLTDMATQNIAPSVLAEKFLRFARQENFH